MNRSLARRNLIARQRGEHLHEHAQVLIGWRGQMECEFRHSGNRLGQGVAALVPASAEHLFAGLSDDSELLVVDIGVSDPYIQALESACRISFADTLFRQPDFIALDSAISPLLDFAAGQLQRGDAPDNPLLSCQLVSLLMTQLCQAYPGVQALGLPPEGRLPLTRLQRFVDQRLAAPPDNAVLAAAMNLSESHLYCLCRRQLGMTPQQYVMSRRMARAQFLVENSRLPLAELAQEVGFADASSFSRAYKTHYRQTPGNARRLRLNRS